MRSKYIFISTAYCYYMDIAIYRSQAQNLHSDNLSQSQSTFKMAWYLCSTFLLLQSTRCTFYYKLLSPIQTMFYSLPLDAFTSHKYIHTGGHIWTIWVCCLVHMCAGESRSRITALLYFLSPLMDCGD